MPLIFFVVIFITSVICMIVSLRRIQKFEKFHLIEKSRKSLLVNASILFPFFGILEQEILKYKFIKEHKKAV
jgi:hypothetical protein